MNIIGGKTCRSCEFKLVVAQNIFCRRYPPTTLIVPQSMPDGKIVPSVQSAFPPVNPDNPCGEYRRNDLYAADELKTAANDGMLRQ